MLIENGVLPNKDPSQRFDVELFQDGVQVTQLADPPPSPPTLLLPTLCHPHIHLDKAYLLTSRPKPANDEDYPDYSDLGLESGDFSEALSKTSQAKTRYTVPDLILRGSQLIAESVRTGVTSMRAFAEVDHVTGFKCLEAAIELKRKFSSVCYIQICAFAQDPILSTEHGDINRGLLIDALERFGGKIEVLGTTPYVEEDQEIGASNIEWAIETAIKYDLHLDFHLDYYVLAEKKALIWVAIQKLKSADWVKKVQPGRGIVFGHCTRMTLFSQEEMQKLAAEIADLPVAFVGLPTSDLFMMGRPSEDASQPSRRERGTLQVIDMIEKHNIQACIGVNNCGNAFTPWGSVDPLQLSCMGVGLYQAGTAEQAKTLYECVSTRARRAIGLHAMNNEGVIADMDNFDVNQFSKESVLAIRNEEHLKCTGIDELFPSRHRLTVTDVVWDPPELRLRQVLRKKENPANV